jgi:exopolysaccharide biosynthesis polyprenyl glycosylphosphotransferase
MGTGTDERALTSEREAVRRPGGPSPWRSEPTGRRLLRVAGDLAAALAAFSGAFWLRIHVPLPGTQGLMPADRLYFLRRDSWIVLVAQLLFLYAFGFYDRPRPRGHAETAQRLLGLVAVQGLALAGTYFLADRSFPRTVLLLFMVLNLALLFLWREVIDRAGARLERRVALVGSGEGAREIAATIALHHWHGLRVAGFIPLPGEEVPAVPEAALGPCLGTPDDLARLLAEGEIDDIILASSGESWQTRLIDSLAGTRPDHTNVLLLPGPFESLIGRMRYRWVHDLPLIEVVRDSEWRINRPLKRLIDLAGAVALLALSSPLSLLTALAIRLTSPGPILYRQERVGLGQRPFTVHKFRTMCADAEAASGEVLAQAQDPRLTPVGALLRRFRLDEIPQLVNVLEGTMSLVGPRPERPGFVQRYLKEIPGYAERFSLAPGLTGLAQINGEYHSSPQNKLRYDLAYAANWSLWLDLSILLRTVKIVLTSRGV